MQRVEHWSQTYTQAPWRRQMQMLVLLLLVVAFFAMILVIYVSVSVQSGEVGREIQSLQFQIAEDEQIISDLRAKAGLNYSAIQMEAKARSYGFQDLNMEEAMFLVAPGFSGRQPAQLAPAAQTEVVPAPDLPAEYTESLFVWLQKQINGWFLPLFEVQP